MSSSPESLTLTCRSNPTRCTSGCSLVHWSICNKLFPRIPSVTAIVAFSDYVQLIPIRNGSQSLSMGTGRLLTLSSPSHLGRPTVYLPLPHRTITLLSWATHLRFPFPIRVTPRPLTYSSMPLYGITKNKRGRSYPIIPSLNDLRSATL